MKQLLDIHKSDFGFLQMELLVLKDTIMDIEK